MNRAMMMAIQPKWSKDIASGEKLFEFRNYPAKKGDKIYLYESLGKRLCGDYLNGYVMEGQGAVVGEFVVEECYETNLGSGELDITYHSFVKLDELTNGKYREWGFTNQKYAYEIKDLIVYSAEWQLDKEAVLEDYSSLGEQEHDSVFQYYGKIINAPTQPIPVTEFISWNKLEKFNKQFPNYKEGAETFIEYNKGINGEQIDSGTNYNYPKEELCKLRKPPQSRTYVVEKEF